jgi:hypothetical protein
MQQHPVSAFFDIQRNYKTQVLGPVVTVFHKFGTTSSAPCHACGHPIVRHSFSEAMGDAGGTGAKGWLDNIGGIDGPIWHERVVNGLQDAGINGFIPHPFQIDRIDSPFLRNQNRPNYYYIEVTGRINVDRELFDENEGLYCPTCGHWAPRPGSHISYGDKPHWPLLEKWDDSDIVMFGNIAQGGYYCTRRVVELIRKHGWTGFAVFSFMPRTKGPDLSRDTWFEDYEKSLHEVYPLAPDGVSSLHRPIRFKQRKPL